VTAILEAAGADYQGQQIDQAALLQRDPAVHVELAERQPWTPQ
jgi:hypothetical protein